MEELKKDGDKTKNTSEKKPKKMRKGRSKIGQEGLKKLKNGGYMATMTVIVVVAVIIFNLIVGQLPESIRQFDISNTQIYTVTDTTKELLASLEHEVKLYVVCDPSAIDSRIEKFVNRYAALSDKVDVEIVDAVLHPATVTELGADNDSILVSCEETGKTQSISFDDILVLDQYSYYYYGTTSYTEFDGEGQLTSAIASVTSETSKNIYLLEGHNETSLGSNVTELFDKNSMVTDSINLKLGDSIPDDCDLILSYAPTSDLSDEEYAAILNYMNQGGNFMLLIGTQSSELPNFTKLLNVYGLDFANEKAYLADLQRYYQNTPYYFFPVNKTSHEIMDGLTSDDTSLVIDATALEELEETPDGVTVESFWTTSSNGVLVTEDSQTQGTYIIGATSTRTAEPETVTSESTLLQTDSDAEEKPTLDGEEETAEETTAADTDDTDGTGTATDSDAEESKEVTSKLVVVSAPSIISEQITGTSNLDVFMNAVSWNFDDVTVVSVAAKSLEISYNTIYNGGVYSVFYIAIIPIGLMVIGLVVWMRRRKR